MSINTIMASSTSRQTTSHSLSISQPSVVRITPSVARTTPRLPMPTSRPKIEYVNAIEFINRAVPLYQFQRPVNPERVNEIVREQMAAPKLLFATPIVVVSDDGLLKLCDGQHRLAAIRILMEHGHPGIDELEIMVLTHVCSIPKKAERIYKQVNSQYMRNGAIDRETGALFHDTDAISSDVTAWAEMTYPKQIGTNCPYFDSNCLRTEVNRYLNSDVGRKRDLTAERIIAIFQAENERYVGELLAKSATWHARCQEKGGFVLPAMKPKCRWVPDVLDRY